MDEIQKGNELNLYFINSIEKGFYTTRKLEYIHQNKTIKEFKYSEIYSEEININEKSYINNLNCISLKLPVTGFTKINLILLKINDGSKTYLYDCNLENTLKDIEGNKNIYFLYNFKIGEYKKDTSANNDKIIKDAMVNIQISLLEIQENNVPQKEMNFWEKFDFFMKAIEHLKNINLIDNLLLDTFDEIDKLYMNSREKLKFKEILKVTKFMLKKEEQNDKVIDNFIALFKNLLNNKLIFFDKIDEKDIKDFFELFKHIKDNKTIYDKFNIIVALFHGYYEDNESLLKYLEKKENLLFISDLYKNNLYEPINIKIKDKLINSLIDNSKNLEDFFIVVNKNNNIIDKMKVIVNYSNTLKKLLIEIDINDTQIRKLPLKFNDDIKAEEKLSIFAPLHKKIVEFELNIESEIMLKEIFSFGDVFKNYIKLYENGLGSKEKLDDFFLLKEIIKEEKKINTESIENLYNYVNKLIHLNIIEVAKKNILCDIDLLKFIKEDEYIFDELYKINKDDFLILNHFNLKNIIQNHDNNFFQAFKESQIWKAFCKTKEDTKLYIQTLGNKIDNIKNLKLFYIFLPLNDYNYNSTEEVINWLQKNIMTLDKTIINDEKIKNSFFNSINILFNLCIKVHYDIQKFLSFLEKFFTDDFKHINNMNIIEGFQTINELYIYLINNSNAENNKSILYDAQKKIISFYVSNSEYILNNEYLFITFLNKVIIDSQHLNLDELLNNLENFEIKKKDLLTFSENIKLKIFEFLINKFKSVFNDKSNNSNYMIGTRKAVKHFIIKEIDEMNIIFNDINLLFNNGINMELNEKNIINKLILCAKIKKNEKNQNEINNEQYYETKFKELKEVYNKCKIIINRLENAIQYFTFFGCENEKNKTEMKELLNEFNSKKIKDFFSQENKAKIDKYNYIFNLSDKACVLKNSYSFMNIYEELTKKSKDTNTNENFNNFKKDSIGLNVQSAISYIDKIKKMFEEFNKHQNNIDSFIHFGVKYFYELELKSGESALKKEIDFILNYFLNNTNDENEINIYKSFDKNKFVEYIKKVTMREKIMIKCKDIKHLINIFLNPKNYIHPKKEKKKAEKKIIEKEIVIKDKEQKEEKEEKEEKSSWGFLDFESLLPSFITNKTQVKNDLIGDEGPAPPTLQNLNTIANPRKSQNNINNINNNINSNNNNNVIQNIGNLINKSELVISLNNCIENLENKKISIKDMNQIIEKINTFSLGINMNSSDNNQNEILFEEFFMKLKDIPETLYYLIMKNYDEIIEIFKNGGIEIENTILKDEDIRDFIICVKQINELIKQYETMLNDQKIKDFPKYIMIQFFDKLKENENIFLKSIINYLGKFNQIKLLLNEMIATPAISIQKIKGILSDSDFIIKYDESLCKYILFGKYYEQDAYKNIKEIIVEYHEMENLRQRILTMNRSSRFYKEALMLQKIFNDMKNVLEILKEMDRTCYPDKYCVIFNIKNQKIYCNYDNQKAFNNIKDVINILIEQKEMQSQYMGKYYEKNKIIRLIYGKQINLVYNYIRYKENKEGVDNLLRIITKGRINSSYPPEYVNYSENLFEDMIKNVNNYLFLVLQANGIDSWYNVLMENKIRIKDKEGKDFQGIYLHISSDDNSEKEVLNFYRKMANLPLYTTILMCNNFTTEEQIKAFLYRSILCEREILFMIVNSNHLEPKKRNMLLNTIKYLMDKLISERTQMKSTLIISSTDSNSEIFRSLKNYNPLDFPVKSIEYNENDYVNLPNIFINKITLVQSDSSGVGKSRYIRNVQGAYESNMIYFPIGGNLNRKIIYNRLDESIKKIQEKNLTQVFLHIDLSQTNHHEILKEFLFELIIFKKYSMSSKNSDKIIYFNDKYNIYIELPFEFMKNKNSENDNNYFQKYSIFSLFQENNIKNIKLSNLEDYYEEMSESEKKNLMLNPDFEFIKTLSDSKLQLVSKTLDVYRKGAIGTEIIEPNSTDNLDIKLCNQLLNHFITGANIPNFYQKNIFINLLNDKFLGFHSNPNLIPQTMIKHAKKLKFQNYQSITDDRPLIIYNLITHAVTFAKGFAENIAKSQERTKDIIQIQDYNKRKDLTEELKKREDSQKFRYEQIKPSLISIDKKGKNIKIIPTCNKKSPEDVFLTHLQQLLKIGPNGKIKEEFMTLKYPKEMTSVQLMDEFLDLINARRLSLDLVNKILSEYALTPDNFIKMILILDRINCDIPVILMGETGVGKTSLIKILANIIFKGNLDDNLKILNIYSGIDDNEIIQFLKDIIEEAEFNDNVRMVSMKDEINSMSREQKQKYLAEKKVTEENLYKDLKKRLDKQKIWVFFDEINSCNSMGLLTEILCKKTYLGNKIPKKFVFLAACNPYRAMGELNKIDHVLIHKDQEKRKLVYTVYPLPNNILNFVLDFGNLTLEEEKQYIQIMVRKMMEKIMIDKEKVNISQIIDLAINAILSCQSYIKSTNDVSAVSLREVKRFILFFKYFVKYLLNKKKATDTKDEAIVFYTLKTNYEIYKYAVILSLYICYYLRLPDSKSRKELLNILENNNIFKENFLLVPELEMDYVARNILESKENESLSKGIAKNRALLENLFSLYFCTVNKIPLIICGKPGSTKSLSQKLLQNALKGIVSNTKLCKETKELVVFPYQGSLSSTAEEIKEVFKKAKRHQKNNIDTIAMVCFEEIGLAEVNKNSPLKVIHSELEMNFDFEMSDDFEQNLFNNDDRAKIAFLGISNWSLDASKMNRVIFNVLQEPDIEDLKKTSFEIASSINEKIFNKYITCLDKIAMSYFEYIEQKRRDDRFDVNFHGLRDFYNIIKSITRELSANEENNNEFNLIENKKNLNDIVNRNIERNFGGLPSSVYDFKNIYHKLNEDKKNIIDKNYDVMRCIKENISDKESRFLLLITRNSFDLELINFLIEEIVQQDKNNNNQFETKFILGSTFQQDTNEIYKEKIIGTIRNEITTNNILVLKNLELIYSSLYDLLNQDFEKIDNKYYTRISFGLWKPFSLINRNFKIIVIVNEKNLTYEDPPFLNRFEKHIFSLDTLLNQEEKNLAKDIYEIILKMINFENSKFDLNKFLINFNLEEIEALVYKYSKKKKYFEPNIVVFDEVIKALVVTFTEEIIASIFVSGFRKEKKDIADKIIDVYRDKHPHNFNDFINNKMNVQKNVIYTYSSISDQLVFEKNENNIFNDNNEKENENQNKIILNDDEDDNFFDINQIDVQEEKEKEKEIFNPEKTKEVFIESIKSIIDLEKIIDDFLSEENQNLFVIKFRNIKNELEKMNQINLLIDECLSKYNNNIKKYFIFIVYLIREEDIVEKKEEKNYLISRVCKNCYTVFIDNLHGKDYNLIKLLTMKTEDLFKFFFIDELQKNVDISFRFMAYEFSNNETEILNRNNYRKKMIEKILENKNIQKYIGICLLKLSINPAEILKTIFIKDKNKNKKAKKSLIFEVEYNRNNIDFIDIFKKVIFENVEFYLIKIIYCLEKSQILHALCFNPEMLKKKIIKEKILNNYIERELEHQLTLNKISTNFNMKNKLSVILNIKIPFISKNLILPKIFKFIKDEIIINYQNNEMKLIDVITDNSLIEETINDYYKKLNQLNENIYIGLLNQEIIKEIIYSNDKYLITSLYQDFLLLYILDGKKFNNGDYFDEYYRFIDILVQMRFLNTNEDNFAFANKDKKIKLLKIYDILFNNNIKDNNKNKYGLMLSQILGFLFGYQYEINTLLEIFRNMRKYMPNLLNTFEEIIINKEIKNEISERNPDYCRIVKESLFIIFESLLHCISKQYNIIENISKDKNEIKDEEYDSDLEDEDDDNFQEFSLLNNNINESQGELDKNLLNKFGNIPMSIIENISKSSILVEKKLLLYSKELFVIKNLAKIFSTLNKQKENKLVTNENINALINIICSSQKLTVEKKYKYLFNNFLLLFEILGKILGKESSEFADVIIYLIINQFLIIKDVSYKIKLLNLIFPNQEKNSRVKRQQNPILLERSLPLLIILFNDGIENYNKSDKLIPIYNPNLNEGERREKFLEFVRNENSSQYKLLKIINRPNKVLDQIIIYYFEYLCELYFQNIKKLNKEKNAFEEMLCYICDTSLDYLDEALLFLDDEISGNNKIGNKSNYLNKLGKLYSIAFTKKYINKYIEINKNNFSNIYIWEDINNVLYKKDNKLRKMIKYYILKMYSKQFDNEKEFVEFNLELRKIPIYLKYHGFKLELVKHQYDYNFIPAMNRNEYLEFAQGLSVSNFNKNKFIDFINDANNLNTTDFFFCFYVNNFFLQNFNNEFYMDKHNDLYKFLQNEIDRLPLIPQEAKQLLNLLVPNIFFQKVKPFIGQKISLKQYEIFLYCLRFCLISLGNNRKNFYTDLLSFSCFKTLSNNFLPGKPATFDQFKESYELIKENLTRDPLKFGAYICSCGYFYSVGECTFPTVISNCPICNEKIGGEHHILYKRVGHMRIFFDNQSRKTKLDLSYADKNMNNMLLDEFYANVVSKHETKELRYCDWKRMMGCTKENFVRREKIRELDEISYRILSFIYYSHIFISRILGYINDNDLNMFIIKDMTLFEILETNWDIIQELTSTTNIRIVFNILYTHIYQLFCGVNYFPTLSSYETFERFFNQKIKQNYTNSKDISDYKRINSSLLDYDPFSDMAIIYEKFPPYIYKEEIYPCMEFFLNSKIPSIELFKKKFLNIQNSEDKYPLLKIILTQDMNKIRLLEEIPKINKLSNFLIDKCSFKYSRKSANDLRLKSEFDFNEIKQEVLDFINSWNKIRPLVEGYGCKQFKNNNQKYFTEINTNSPLAYFLVDEGDFGHGMVLAAIYKTLIEIQNVFLNQIINSKSDILSCFNEQLNQEIMIQDVQNSEIIDLNKINNDILIDIIVKNSIPDMFENLNKGEKEINFINICSFEHNYESIERELGSILLPGLRKFKDEIRFVTYKYEGFRGNKSSIITNFNEKYPQKALKPEQIKYINDFLNKGDNKNKLEEKKFGKKEIKNMLFSLQLLIDYLQRENYDRYEQIGDIIQKLPKEINICDEIRIFFKTNDNQKKEQDFSLLNNMEEENINNSVSFGLNTLISIFELFEELCWDSFKDNLVADYLQTIDGAWALTIKQYFNRINNENDKIIKTKNFCTAIRRFISRYLAGKRGENEINENNTLLNEIIRPELWEPYFTESDTFELEIGKLMEVTTDEFAGSLKVGQALYLYNYLLTK